MQNTKLTKLRNRINRSRERFNRLYYSDDNPTGSRESTDSRGPVNAALERVAKECEDCKRSGKTQPGPLKLPGRLLTNDAKKTALEIGKAIANQGNPQK